MLLRRNLLALIFSSFAVWVGLSQSVPFGVSGALWPVTGVALALVARYGAAVIPAILIAHIPFLSDATLLENYGIQMLTLSVGASLLQAWIGALLVARFAPLPEALSSELRVFFMVSLGAVSASIGPLVVALGCLMQAVDIPEGCFFFVLTWWAWNFLSVLVLTPLVTILLYAFTKEGRPHMWVASTVLVLMLATIGLFQLVSRSEDTTRRAEFEKSATRLSGNIARSVDIYVGVLDSIKNFYAASQEVDRAEFQTFTKRWILRYPAIQALQWVPRVPEEEVDAYIARAKAEGFSDFKIWGRSDAKMYENKKRLYFPVF